MGFKYEEFLDLTWREFKYYAAGHERRIEREWDYARHIIASNYNSSGFAKKTVKATEVMTLPHLDSKYQKPLKLVDPKRLAEMLKVINNQ